MAADDPRGVSGFMGREPNPRFQVLLWSVGVTSGLHSIRLIRASRLMSSSDDRSLMTVIRWRNTSSRGVSDRQESLLLNQADEEDFSLEQLRHSQYLGYRFGYRRQFALISASYAKLQVGMGLASLLITLDYAYLS
jgi:hypothetical protein